MGMLDHLIAKNVEPKVGMEYRYLMDMMWEEGRFEHVNVKYGSIVVDVVKRDDNSLEFTLKEDGKRYLSNYGYAFAENTPENMENLMTYIQAKEILDVMKYHVDKLRKKVIDLSPKNENV